MNVKFVFFSLFTLSTLNAPAPAFECDGVDRAVGEDIGLHFVGTADRPVDVATPTGETSHLFIVEQRGRIRILDLADDSVKTTPYLDITSKVACCGEQGLLGLTFHPNYAENGYFYVNYTRRSGAVCSASPPRGCSAKESETVVARYQVFADNPLVADPASEKILLSFCQPFGNHNGGQIKFGPNDGYLYISTGDGGSGSDPCNSGQDAGSFLGKLLRIDVDTADPYAIPESNPYRETGGARPEIWALGLRNPWRFCFDPDNGDLYIADVGQGSWEEINYQRGDSLGGENYQWRVREGDHSFNAGTSFGPGEPGVGPIYEYGHSRGRSVTGGVVYRGCRLPDLHGRYFFADYASHWVQSFRIDASGNPVDLKDHTAEFRTSLRCAGVTALAQNISAFGVDGQGEMYICDVNTGRLYRVIADSDTANHCPIVQIQTDPTPAVVTLFDGSAEILLDGSLSDDGDGGTQELSYSWRRARGPRTLTIVSPDSAATAVRFIESGEYRVRLTVTDPVTSNSETIAVTVEPPPPPQFLRGDCNDDGTVEIADALATLEAMFLGERVIACEDACDTNDDGENDISDPIATLRFVFLDAGIPLPGITDCGVDPSDDVLGCEGYGSCD